MTTPQKKKPFRIFGKALRENGGMVMKQAAAYSQPSPRGHG